VQDICRATPFFLTVGTLEPRKNHAVALAAFDLIWKAGIDAKYVIFGEFGWLAYAMRERITRHPEFGRRLFWLEGGDDAELRYLYRHTAALIHPSVTEGFGLPIIEAAHFEAPVIASDIRIFREIGGEAISYFDPMDPAALARLIKEALTAPRTAASINALSWKEATERLLKLVKEETYLFRVDPVRPT
jgi:alpha-1,2-rhamnosyltransferase